MSLELILAAIRAEGEAQLAELRRSTAVEIAAILDEADCLAQQRYEQAYQQALAPAEAETRQIVEAARAEAWQITAEAGDVVLNDLIAAVGARLAHVRARADYPQIWQWLARDAVRALGDEESAGATLDVDPRDADLADLFEWRGMQIRPVLDCQGGSVVRSRDGKIVVDNRIETRLERALPALRLIVARLVNGRV